jgi:hypothetical protein
MLWAEACSHRPIISEQGLRKNWYGKHINKAIERLGTPDRVVQHPDDGKCYYFRFTEEVGEIDIFQRKPDFDGSTIKIQEQIARAEQSSCLCRMEVKDEIIQHIDFTGKGCINIQKKLE